MNHNRLLALEMCSMKAARQQNCNESQTVLGFRDVITEGCNAEKLPRTTIGVITEGYHAEKLPRTTIGCRL